jgi:hypothetical protein
MAALDVVAIVFLWAWGLGDQGGMFASTQQTDVICT